MLARLRRLVHVVGPGVVTGAADDDPSGIATYSQAGAQFGYGQLWTVPIMLPMMAAIQEICARIGMVKGKGIAGVVREHHSRGLLFVVVSLIVVANTINLGTDLCAMAASTRLLVALPHMSLVVFFALVTIALQTLASYRVYSRFLKWMSLFLLAYVITGFIVSHHWGEVLRATFLPHVDMSFEFLMILVAVLGTTISPYMFFWQASQQVEEEIESGEICPPSEVRQLRCGPLPVLRTDDVHNMRMDTWAGMAFSQAATWFIMLTTAGSLHAAGMTDISTAADAARALEPLVKSFAHSGEIAKTIFALGIIGLGLMAVPIFAGAASYALSETFGWDVGLSKRFREAPYFYGVIVLATLTGVFINCAGIDPIKALVYTAVINGVVAVPLIYVILRIGRNPSIMGEHVTTPWINRIGWFTFTLMGISAILMFLTWRM